MDNGQIQLPLPLPSELSWKREKCPFYYNSTKIDPTSPWKIRVTIPHEISIKSIVGFNNRRETLHFAPLYNAVEINSKVIHHTSPLLLCQNREKSFDIDVRVGVSLPKYHFIIQSKCIQSLVKGHKSGFGAQASNILLNQTQTSTSTNHSSFVL